MTTQEELQELSKAIARKMGWTQNRFGAWVSLNATLALQGKGRKTPPDFASREWLYELEGELQQNGWSFDFATNNPEGGWVAMNPHTLGSGLTFPNTVEDRAKLIMTAWLKWNL